MRKKAQVFMMLMVLVTIVSCTMLFMIMREKTSGTDYEIGKRQLGVLQANAKAQQALQYIDFSAELAARQAYYEMVENGGTRSQDCGEYFGYPVWIDAEKDCTPLQPESAFASFMSVELDRLLVLYTDMYIPLANYEFSFEDGRLVGYAREDLRVAIVPSDEVSSAASESEPVATPGVYGWPAKGEQAVVTSCYGDRYLDPERKEIDDHHGIDMRAGRGDPIYAIADGVVDKVKQDPWGNLIVDHENGLKSKYLHCERILVEEGQRVKKGQVVARAGDTAPQGTNVPVHIHFEILKDDKPADPLKTVYSIAGDDIYFKYDSNCVYFKDNYAYAGLITKERTVT